MPEHTWEFPEPQSNLQEAIAAYARMPWLQALNRDTGCLGLCVDLCVHLVQYLQRCGLISPATQGDTWDYESFDLLCPGEPTAVPAQSIRARQPLIPDPQYRRGPGWEEFDSGPDWPSTAWHCVLRIENTIYDFSPRQFNEDLPFPFIWTIEETNAE